MSNTVYIVQETWSGFIHGYCWDYDSALKQLKALQKKDRRLDDLVIISANEFPSG